MVTNPKAPPATVGPLQQDMLTFRTAYLRIVAETWADPGFRTRLTTGSIAHRQAELANAFRVFGFDPTQWSGLELEVGGKGATWDQGSWYGDGESKITLKLPLSPKCGKDGDEEYEIDPKDRAEALASYYEERPTMFGKTQNLTNGFGHGLGDWGDFLEFGAIILQAIGLAWEKPAFAASLQKDALRALQGWLHYTSPWNMKIEIKESHVAKVSSAGNWIWSLEKNVVTLDLPKAPEIAVQPVALCRYNNAGNAYPFSCCAA
jgi:ribosomally synthesized peptide (two-chain TOMM family)